jgi:phage gpG-like protein
VTTQGPPSAQRLVVADVATFQGCALAGEHQALGTVAELLRGAVLELPNCGGRPDWTAHGMCLEHPGLALQQPRRHLHTVHWSTAMPNPVCGTRRKGAHREGGTPSDVRSLEAARRIELLYRALQALA